MSYIFMFSKLWCYAAGSRWKVVLYFFLHSVSLVAMLLQPLVLGKLLNSLQQNNNGLMQEILYCLQAYVALFLVFNIFHRLGRHIEQRLAFRIKQSFVTEMYDLVLDMPLQWHQENHSGSIISRIKIAADALYSFSELQFQYIEYFFTFFGPLIALFILSTPVSCVAFLIAVVTIFVIGKFDKKLVNLFKMENDTQNEFMSAFFDCISNVRTVLALKLQNKSYVKINEKMSKAYRILVQSITYNQYKWAVVSLLIFLMEIGIIFYYIIAQTRVAQVIAIGSVVAMFQYLQQLSKMFFNIAACYQDIVHMQSNFLSVFPMIVSHRGISEHKQRVFKKKWKQFKLSDVCFGYASTDKVVINDLSMELRNGEKVAIIGKNGSGKSTLLNIISGMLEAKQCNYFVDGFPSDGVPSSILVPQDPEIFEDTALYNITFGSDFSQEDLDQVLSISKFDEVVEKLPNGLMSNVMEKGVNLSGGEKQRLALCRGIYVAKDSDIVLLDEPTSSVDVENELEIYQQIFKAFPSKCIVSIIHKLNLLPLFDVIYVMQNGEIVQTGTFDELKSQQSGPFAKLWKEYNRSRK